MRVRLSLIATQIVCIMISVFAAGAWAQNDQLPSSAVEKPGPVYTHGEPVYRVGGDVKAPRSIYAPDPEYSEEARLGELQGTSVLWVVVGADGKPQDVRIDRPLGMGLDEKSIEAIRTWRFEPARKDGQPVAVQVNVETSFRLYSSPGLPAILDPLHETGQSLPDEHAARYPLLVEVAYVTGKQTTSGYVVSAEATIPGGAQPRKLTITCRPKRKCFMLERGTYRARWLRGNEIELTGRSDNNHKSPKVQFSAVPVL